MRYVTTPLTATFNGAPFGFPILLANFILGAPQWRDEWADQWDEAQLAAEALATALPASVTPLTDEIHERFAVILKGAQVNPAALPVAMPFIHAVIRASTKKPDPPAPEAPAASIAA